MSLLQNLKNLFSTSGNKFYRNLFLSLGNSPLENDDADSYVHKGYMYNADVYAIVDYLTRAIKTVKWGVYEIKDGKKHQIFQYEAKDMLLSNQGKYLEQKSMIYEKVQDPNNKLYRMLKQPNPMQSWAEFIENFYGFKFITGESFINGIILRNGANAGLINELWVLPPQLMQIVATKQSIIQEYRLKALYANQEVPFSPEEILHEKYFNPDYRTANAHLRGLSPLQAGARVLRQSNDSYVANAAMLQNNGAMGILSVDPDHMTEEQAARLQEKYEQKYSGAHNMGKIIIAGGKFDWKQIGLSPVDLGIIESQKMSLRDLCNIYGISSSLLNDPDNNTYSNMQEARMALYMEKIFPELDSFRDNLNKWLVSRFNEKTGKQYYIDYDINSIPAIQSALKQQTERFFNAWWLTANERRVAMGYDSDESLENIWMIPRGIVPYTKEQMASGEAVRMSIGNFDDSAEQNNENDATS